MFYSTQVLARKGALGMVWLAAHMDSRLKKDKVFQTSLVNSIGMPSDAYHCYGPSVVKNTFR